MSAKRRHSFKAPRQRRGRCLLPYSRRFLEKLYAPSFEKEEQEPKLGVSNRREEALHCIDRKGDSPRSMDRKGNGEKEREGRKIYFLGGKGREIAACFSSFHLMARPPRRVENNRRKRLESRAKSVDNRRRYFSPTD